MKEFLSLVPPADAMDRFLGEIVFSPAPESIATERASGRVLFEDVHARHSLPAFARSTVDGYAVRAADTHGAGDSLPAYLLLQGEILMGRGVEDTLKPGACMLIHTGGMLPEGADAVVMVEDTQPVSESEIEIRRAVGGGDNVIKPGEDVREGDLVIAAGARLRPAEIGGLMALGLTQVRVARRPRVAILSSGDEVVPPDVEPGPGQVRDVNSYALQSLVRDAGGEPVLSGILPDRIDAFRAAAAAALESSDLVVFTAGSSISVRDLTGQVIAELGPPGVLVHGVNVRPGKPTILAVCSGVPVVGLPGNPVSALVIAGLFVRPAIDGLLGRRRSPVRPSVAAILSTNLPSRAGREDRVPVRLLPDGDGLRAEPVFGKSNLIFTLSRADGLVTIPAAANGLPAGAVVQVELI